MPEVPAFRDGINPNIKLANWIDIDDLPKHEVVLAVISYKRGAGHDNPRNRRFHLGFWDGTCFRDAKSNVNLSDSFNIYGAWSLDDFYRVYEDDEYVVAIPSDLVETAMIAVNQDSNGGEGGGE
jgi:hypothetical protein